MIKLNIEIDETVIIENLHKKLIVSIRRKIKEKLPEIVESHLNKLVTEQVTELDIKKEIQNSIEQLLPKLRKSQQNRNIYKPPRYTSPMHRLNA